MLKDNTAKGTACWVGFFPLFFVLYRKKNQSFSKYTSDLSLGATVRGLFIFWERIAAAAGSCHCCGLVVIPRQLGVGHELVGEVGTFLKGWDAGGDAGL